jgi:hypothetical protein
MYTGTFKIHTRGRNYLEAHLVTHIEHIIGMIHDLEPFWIRREGGSEGRSECGQYLGGSD